MLRAVYILTRNVGQSVRISDDPLEDPARDDDLVVAVEGIDGSRVRLSASSVAPLALYLEEERGRAFSSGESPVPLPVGADGRVSFERRVGEGFYLDDDNDTGLFVLGIRDGEIRMGMTGFDRRRFLAQEAWERSRDARAKARGERAAD